MALSYIATSGTFAGMTELTPKAKQLINAFPCTEVRNEHRKLREFDHEEYFITSHFDSVEESLRLFADDELISEPGNCIVTLNLGFPFQIFVLLWDKIRSRKPGFEASMLSIINYYALLFIVALGFVKNTQGLFSVILVCKTSWLF